MGSVLSVNQFYGGENSIHRRWFRRDDVGAAIVPSAYNAEYVPYLADAISSFIFNGKILSIGSGCGDVECYIKANGIAEVVASDLFPAACEICRERGLDVVRCDASMLPFPGGLFSAVLLDGVFGHLFAENKHHCVMNELARVVGSARPIIICDDESADGKIDCNPRVKLTRFSDECFDEVILALGGAVVWRDKFAYIKGYEGLIKRRISVVSFF